MNKKERELEIKWAEDKINYYTNKIYRKKLKMEAKKQELKTLIESNNDLSVDREQDLIEDILIIDYKIEEIKKEIKAKYKYLKELMEV